VKHAGPEALHRLEPLIRELRAIPDLREKKAGSFYRRSRAFLHFHEDPTGLFVDVRFDRDFERMAVTTRPEQERFLSLVRAAVLSE